MTEGQARQINPVIDSIYDLDTAHDAITHVRRRSHFGKIVIRTS